MTSPQPALAAGCPEPAPLRWVIVTGEFPPQPGGVSDYTSQLARALVDCGDEVHICAPQCDGSQPQDPGLSIHHLKGGFGISGLRELRAHLQEIPQPYNLLVQYVPQAFGWKGLNIAFAFWIYQNRRRAPWVMFHEVCTPLSWRQPATHALLGLGTRLMASAVLRAAHKVYVSTTAWRPLLSSLAPDRRPVECLPTVSNLPLRVDHREVARLRKAFAPEAGSLVIGHFGTYGNLIRPYLDAVLPQVLTQNRVALCLIGRHSDDFRRELLNRFPALAAKVHATGEIARDTAACCLSACDVLIQPYPDGVTTRRGSMMAALALGRAIVTTDGPLTESIWRESAAVALASTKPGLVHQTKMLLSDPARRARQGARAASMYQTHFSLDRTVRELRAAAAPESSSF